jgi:hypothetical protein
MKTNYILIDFENTQPESIPLLKEHPFKVLVFVGDRQGKVPFALAEALQKLGTGAEYIKIEGNGKNALDFHIAYYIGRIAAQDPDAFFHIISKDSGFDPLIKHLKGKKVFADRVANIEDIPLLKKPTPLSAEERIAATIKSLRNKGTSRPRKLNTLRNTVSAQFKKALEENELNTIINALKKRQIVTLNGESVSYHFPEEAG